MLDLRRLQVLYEFTNHGTIAATAIALGYTPSAISQQIATLEREVGAPLLDRTARSAELTDAGRLLAEHAEQILAMVEAAEAVVAAQTDVAMGRVSVTAFPTAAVAFSPALAHSLREHTGMQLLLRQTPGDAGISQVARAEADIALVDDWSGRGPEQSRGKLRFHHLLRDPMVLALPEEHPLADPATAVDLNRLSHESWLATARGEPSRLAMDQLLADVAGAPTTAWEFEGLGTILSLVARGLGIAAVPSLALAAGTSGLAFRSFPAHAPVRDVYAVVRSASVRRPSINVTLRAIYTAAEDIRGSLAMALPEGPAGG